MGNSSSGSSKSIEDDLLKYFFAPPSPRSEDVMSPLEETEKKIRPPETPLGDPHETEALRNIGDDLDCLRLSYPRLDSDDSSGSFESFKSDRLKEEFLYFKEGPFSFWSEDVMSPLEETEEEIRPAETRLWDPHETKALRNIGDDLDCLRLSYPRDRAGGLGWLRPSYRLDSDDSSGSFESFKSDRLKEEFLYFKEGPFSFWMRNRDKPYGSFESFKSGHSKDDFFDFKEGPFSFWHWDKMRPSPTQASSV